MTLASSAQLTSERGNAILFLLAHPDDEFVLAPIIRDAKSEGRRIAVIYLTNNDSETARMARCSRESLRLLGSLGLVVEADAVFLGERLAIPGGTLFRNLPAMHEALLQHAQHIMPVETIYVHAWEGGDPDHDAAHALALGLEFALGLSEAVLQVPFYRSPRWRGLPVALFSPLAANGPVTYYRQSLLERLQRLTMIRYYPSQVHAFLRFFPCLLFDAFLRPGVPVQRACASRLAERPMSERLHYERNGLIEFSAMAPYIDAYWSAVSTHRSQREERPH